VVVQGFKVKFFQIIFKFYIFNIFFIKGNTCHHFIGFDMTH
jgi:hypothetical protein